MGISSSTPVYWKNSLEHIRETMSQIKRGKAEVLTRSAGGREIYAVFYGEKQHFGRRANFNSACGAHDVSAYAKKNKETKPVIVIVGGVHGGELEGVAAVLNWIHMLETGADYGGNAIEPLTRGLEDHFRLVLIPCMNPDGRARIPFDTFKGLSMTDLRYYVQGTWLDGSLCGWPACKAVHPLADAVSHLGGYFNDDGVNLMHDNFFLPMAEETRRLMQLIDEEAADATILLHGGANSKNHLIPTQYISPYIEEKQNRLVGKVHEAYQAKGIPFNPIYSKGTRPGSPPPSFNLSSALHHISGGISMVFESNMGLNAPGDQYSYEEMLEGHYILFEQLLKFVKDEYPFY